VKRTLTIAATAVLLAFPSIAFADEQAAIDACVDKLREVGGPDGQAGTVLSSEYSEAGTMVHLRDAGMSEWDCIGYNDGTVGDIHVVNAMDDGEGAMAGADPADMEPASGTTDVHFQKGTSGASYSATLEPGGSMQYVLDAKSGQNLSVVVKAGGGPISYQIWNPDNSALLDLISTDKPYQGQLWQSGKHKVEVINSTNEDKSYDIEFMIK
jgi:hypothetical protein